ncbi:component of the polarisome [Basidiobolus ranarum]|uniref:Component of the polarisome n=1 Tax=Basidiobolus ranarum TaxID=34480 RepID=A0ABR2X1N5_9FUNG
MAADLAITHHEGLRTYLSSYLQREQAGISEQRKSAREKLTKLSRQQFQELSTDVYDELTRRMLNSSQAPFLPVSDDFHPKRNQARQKLATLSKTRFKDLASDVFCELERRYPELKEQRIKENMVEKPRSLNSQPTSSIPPYANDSIYSSKSDGDIRDTARNKDAMPTDVSKSVILKSSSKGEDNLPNYDLLVNFDSLDNLMADLGHMIGENKEARDPPKPKINSPNSTKKLPSKEEHPIQNGALKHSNSGSEEETEALRKDSAELSHVSSQPNASAAESIIVKQLQDELEKQKSLNQQQDLILTKLQRDHEHLLKDYKSQLEVSNSIKSEMSTLLSEIESVSKKNEELILRHEQTQAKLKHTTDERTKIQQKLDETKSELRRLKATSAYIRTAPKTHINDNSLMKPHSHGVIEVEKVTSYQVAVDDLLCAARSDTPTGVLMAMKSIVITCKALTESVEKHEQRIEVAEGDNRRENINTLMSRISTNLSNLMAAAKNHATGFGVSPVSLLDAAANNLTVVIVDLVRQLKIKKSRTERPSNPDESGHSDDDVTLSTVLSNLSTRDTSPSSGKQSILEVNELKQYLERQTDSIVQAIQALLQIIRSSQFGQELTATIENINTIVQDLVNISRHSFTNSTSGMPYRHRAEAILSDLESSNSKMFKLQSDLTKGTDDAQASSSPNHKILKQKLASASFEIAKYTKELVGLIE